MRCKEEAREAPVEVAVGDACAAAAAAAAYADAAGASDWGRGYEACVYTGIRQRALKISVFEGVVSLKPAMTPAKKAAKKAAQGPGMPPARAESAGKHPQRNLTHAHAKPSFRPSLELERVPTGCVNLISVEFCGYWN